VFDDSSTKRIRSDGKSEMSGVGPYPHAVNCVTDRVGTGGFYFLRTVSLDCMMPPVERLIDIDFSSPVGEAAANCTVDDAYDQPGTLNICGSNMLPDVRLIANKLFANSALSNGTPVSLPISLTRSFTGPGAFHLEFEQAVGVTAGANANIRNLIAGSLAVAELYRNAPNSQGGRQSLGRFYMPFSATVTRVP